MPSLGDLARWLGTLHSSPEDRLRIPLADSKPPALQLTTGIISKSQGLSASKGEGRRALATPPGDSGGRPAQVYSYPGLLSKLKMEPICAQTLNGIHECSWWCFYRL